MNKEHYERIIISTLLLMKEHKLINQQGVKTTMEYLKSCYDFTEEEKVITENKIITTKYSGLKFWDKDKKEFIMR